jgi:hypothetical protein
VVKRAKEEEEEEEDETAGKESKDAKEGTEGRAAAEEEGGSAAGEDTAVRLSSFLSFPLSLSLILFIPPRHPAMPLSLRLCLFPTALR